MRKLCHGDVIKLKVSFCQRDTRAPSCSQAWDCSSVASFWWQVLGPWGLIGHSPKKCHGATPCVVRWQTTPGNWVCGLLVVQTGSRDMEQTSLAGKELELVQKIKHYQLDISICWYAPNCSAVYLAFLESLCSILEGTYLGFPKYY